MQENSCIISVLYRFVQEEFYERYVQFKKKIHAKTILSVLAGIIAGIAIFAGGCIYVYNVYGDIPQLEIYVVCEIRIQQLI